MQLDALQHGTYLGVLRPWWIASIALPVLVIGCNRGPKLVPVTGIVRIDGKPLTTGTVRFTPAAGRAATGTIRSDGTFELGTFSSSDGAMIGVHGVSVTAFAAPQGTPDYDNDGAISKPPPSPIPGKYTSADSSGLTFEVKPGETNHAEIELTSK